MTHQRKKCNHCRVGYSFQASGEGCQDKNNNPEYCPECMGVINKALESVSVKVEMRQVDTDEVTIEQILEYDKGITEDLVSSLPCGFTLTGERPSASKIRDAVFSIPVKRIQPTLYNSDVGGFQRRIHARIDGCDYWLIFWPSSPEDYEIKKEVEWDIEKGEIYGG